MTTGSSRLTDNPNRWLPDGDTHHPDHPSTSPPAQQQLHHNTEIEELPHWVEQKAQPTEQNSRLSQFWLGIRTSRPVRLFYEVLGSALTYLKILDTGHKTLFKAQAMGHSILTAFGIFIIPKVFTTIFMSGQTTREHFSRCSVSDEEIKHHLPVRFLERCAMHADMLFLESNSDKLGFSLEDRISFMVLRARVRNLAFESELTQMHPTIGGRSSDSSIALGLLQSAFKSLQDTHMQRYFQDKHTAMFEQVYEELSKAGEKSSYSKFKVAPYRISHIYDAWLEQIHKQPLNFTRKQRAWPFFWRQKTKSCNTNTNPEAYRAVLRAMYQVREATRSLRAHGNDERYRRQLKAIIAMLEAKIGQLTDDSRTRLEKMIQAWDGNDEHLFAFVQQFSTNPIVTQRVVELLSKENQTADARLHLGKNQSFAEFVGCYMTVINALSGVFISYYGIVTLLASLHVNPASSLFVTLFVVALLVDYYASYTFTLENIIYSCGKIGELVDDASLERLTSKTGREKTAITASIVISLALGGSSAPLAWISTQAFLTHFFASWSLPILYTFNGFITVMAVIASICLLSRQVYVSCFDTDYIDNEPCPPGLLNALKYFWSHIYRTFFKRLVDKTINVNSKIAEDYKGMRIFFQYAGLLFGIVMGVLTAVINIYGVRIGLLKNGFGAGLNIFLTSCSAIGSLYLYVPKTAQGVSKMVNDGCEWMISTYAQWFTQSGQSTAKQQAQPSPAAQQSTFCKPTSAVVNAISTQGLYPFHGLEALPKRGLSTSHSVTLPSSVENGDDTLLKKSWTEIRVYLQQESQNGEPPVQASVPTVLAVSGPNHPSPPSGRSATSPQCFPSDCFDESRVGGAAATLVECEQPAVGNAC